MVVITAKDLKTAMKEAWKQFWKDETWNDYKHFIKCFKPKYLEIIPQKQFEVIIELHRDSKNIFVMEKNKYKEFKLKK